MEQDWLKFRTETKKQLSTFVNSSESRKIAHRAIYDAFDNFNDNSLDVIATLKIISQNNNPREAAIVGMMAFLWEFEGSFTTCIDAYCFLLISNGHDLFNRKYVKSLEDIGNVNISTKLNFLEEHEFKIFKRQEDRDLRNKIAHHDFILDKSGKVIIKGQEVDVSSRFNNLFQFTDKVFKNFCGCVAEC